MAVMDDAKTLFLLLGFLISLFVGKTSDKSGS